MNKKTTPAIITATLGVGSTGATPYYDVNITQQLCTPACVDETPVFNPQFSVREVATVGTNQHLAVIHVEGVINYIPCNCGSCCTRSQVVSQDFTIPIYKTSVPTVTLTAGQAQNGIARISCCDCSKTFVSDVPLTLTIA